MANDSDLPSVKRDTTPGPQSPAAGVAGASSLPQKRAFEDDHVPAVSSPLNPNLEPRLAKAQSHDDLPAAVAREKPSRTKKESLKKRESKGVTGAAPDSSRATPDPKHQDVKGPTSDASPLRYKLAPPKPSDFEAARGPVLTHHHTVTTGAGSELEFCESSEHVSNKKNFHYVHCIADPAFPSSFYYRQTEPDPHGAHISFEDAATHMYVDQTARHITTDKGFRMARANVAVRQGRWYWECKITQGTVSKIEGGKVESHGHVRLGFARREASLDAPVGFDAYSYGIRDVEGQKIHMSRPKDFFSPGEDIKEGDVIGLEIQLPSENLHRKIVQGHYNPAVDLIDEDDTTAPLSAEGPNIVRDRIPIRFKAHIYFEKIDYHSTKELEDLMNPSPVGASGAASSSESPNPNHQHPAMRTLPNSHIKIYKNGVCMGTPFTDLLAFLPPASKPQAQVGAREGMDDGMLGYYPAISVFRGGAAEVNFGPDFWFPPPEPDKPAEGALKKGDDEGDQEMTGTDDTNLATNANGGVDVVATLAAQTKAAPAPLRPLAERYDEQIAEDIVADIVDEVDFWMQDGGRVIDLTGGRDSKADVTAGLVPGSEEIKELVQDD